MNRRPPRPLRPSGFRPLAEINVTPLVDVMLVLLVVFMITAPMLAAGIRVDLPRASAARPLPPREPVVVAVARDGALFLGTEAVAREALVAAVRQRLGEDGDRAVHVRGDREAPYGDIVAVVDLLAAGGLGRIALVARSAETTVAAAPAEAGR